MSASTHPDAPFRQQAAMDYYDEILRYKAGARFKYIFKMDPSKWAHGVKQSAGRRHIAEEREKYLEFYISLYEKGQWGDLGTFPRDLLRPVGPEVPGKGGKEANANFRKWKKAIQEREEEEDDALFHSPRSKT